MIRGRWWRATEKVTLAAAVAVVTSGLAGTFYFRPHGHDLRARLAAGHLRFHVAAVGVLDLVHRVSAYLLVACGLALAIGWLVHRRRLVRVDAGVVPALPRRIVALVVGLGLAAMFFVASGHLLPWQRLLPWSPTVGPNLARPMTMVGHDGPFPETVGVNLRYDDRLVTLARRRWGLRAVSRTYFAHVLMVPLGLVLLGVLTLRRPGSAATRAADHP